MTNTIHIYIPFYKGIRHLKAAVQSVLNQSSEHWKLTVVDDCGPDGEQAETFISSLQNANVSYIRHEKNIGMSQNWNFCFDHAKNENAHFTTLLHDDDMLLNNYVEVMLQEFSSDSSFALISCGAEIISNSGEPVFSVPDYVKSFIRPKMKNFILDGENGFALLLKGNFIMCPTNCYNLNVIGSEKFATHFRQVQDLEFYFRLLERQERIKCIATKAYAYRRHDLAATSLQTASLLRFDEECELYERWSEVLKRLGYAKAAKIADAKSIIKLNLAFCFFMDLIALRFKPAFRKLSFVRRLYFSKKNNLY